jgi:hypothetical protein
MTMVSRARAPKRAARSSARKRVLRRTVWPGMRAEISRVKRKRPDSLDAYDLVPRAQLDVDSGMPEQVSRALVLLERAIELDPAYALAHGNAAMCHHCLFLRAGLQEVNRAASIHLRRTVQRRRAPEVRIQAAE